MDAALIDGGTIQYDRFYGQPQVAAFHPASNTFTNVQNMARGRWCPTVLTLGDGRVMAFSGLSTLWARAGASSIPSARTSVRWKMSFTAGSGALTVTAPPNGNIAPPGYYMLFILNSSGVPSVATFVQG